jgi:hypothetical protein
MIAAMPVVRAERALKSPEPEHYRFVAPLSSHQPGGADRARRLHVGARVERIVADAKHVILRQRDGRGFLLSSALYGVDHQWQ